MPGSPLCRHFDIRIIIRSKTSIYIYIYIKVQTHRGHIQITTYNKNGLNTTKHTQNSTQIYIIAQFLKVKITASIYIVPPNSVARYY
jgi:hypothetical protein